MYQENENVKSTKQAATVHSNGHENNYENVKTAALRHIDRRNFGERLILVDAFVYALVKAGDISS